MHDILHEYFGMKNSDLADSNFKLIMLITCIHIVGFKICQTPKFDSPNENTTNLVLHGKTIEFCLSKTYIVFRFKNAATNTRIPNKKGPNIMAIAIITSIATVVALLCCENSWQTGAQILQNLAN